MTKQEGYVCTVYVGPFQLAKLSEWMKQTGREKKYDDEHAITITYTPPDAPKPRTRIGYMYEAGFGACAGFEVRTYPNGGQRIKVLVTEILTPEPKKPRYEACAADEGWWVIVGTTRDDYSLPDPRYPPSYPGGPQAAAEREAKALNEMEEA